MTYPRVINNAVLLLMYCSNNCQDELTLETCAVSTVSLVVLPTVEKNFSICCNVTGIVCVLSLCTCVITHRIVMQ